SLKLLLLQKKIKQAFGKNITIAELFKYPSVRELCAYLFALGAVNKADYSAPINNIVNTPEPTMDSMSLEDLQRFISGESVDS
ncbi:phosphopantetheine-binding protein, partial [Serratia ficaria]|uniref:phosphopantetheine-binding protein n=1 Tax=Serratia ficaria TaxID=61651 RepID=UPI0021C94CA4